MNQYAKGEDVDLLLNPQLLQGISEKERQEALEAAEVARRAEERAEMRMALQRRLEERQRWETKAAATIVNGSMRDKELSHVDPYAPAAAASGSVKYVPKKKRMMNKDTTTVTTSSISTHANDTNQNENTRGKGTSVSSKTNSGVTTTHGKLSKDANHGRSTYSQPSTNISSLTDVERELLKRTYLGKVQGEGEDVSSQPLVKKKQTSSKATKFKFQWEDTEDTFATTEKDPLYSSMIPLASRAITTKKRFRNQDDLILDEDDGNNRNNRRQHYSSVQTKPIEKMTSRDWRIYRENYNINVKGGKAPPPLRNFRESSSPDLPALHPALLDAIENVLQFHDPSPIQRQAIPVGLQRRDMIGLAETGSGKTVAFGVPLCQYLLSLPSQVLSRVADDGPLALIMAPTRELALQIEGELSKLLSRQDTIQTCAIVGGQSIQQQAQDLRRGVHIVVGTPGRMNECLEMAYLVLNQCCYIVLDEADRMIDMGFAPQMETILDAMGGSLKSEDEERAYQQEMEDLKKGDVARHRLTAMFSATMPQEVERLAKQYLRHPVIVSVGDRDTVKNARIVQNVMFLSSPSQKEKILRDLMRDPRFSREKIIVFVNEKKHAEGVARTVESSGRSCVVLHGGKSQEQREENLEKFRRGGVVMVATDVLGRGIDIVDVAHVINYDLPTRSIENYTHRIGRTGRAGKEGLATSFITDEDEGIMPALKAYLESTGNKVPDRLARHPAASAIVDSNVIY